MFAAPLMAGIVGLGAALAFYQYNERPFINALESAFYFFIGTKLYLWKKDRERVSAGTLVAQNNPINEYVPKLTDSKLHDLAWSLDIQDRIASGTDSRTRKALDKTAPLHTAREALGR